MEHSEELIFLPFFFREINFLSLFFQTSNEPEGKAFLRSCEGIMSPQDLFDSKVLIKVGHCIRASSVKSEPKSEPISPILPQKPMIQDSQPAVKSSPMSQQTFQISEPAPEPIPEPIPDPEPVVSQPIVDLEAEPDTQPIVEISQNTQQNSQISQNSQQQLPRPQISEPTMKSSPIISRKNTIYRHALTGDHLTISSNFEFIGKKSEKMDKLLANQSIKKLIEDGILVKIGSHHLTPKIQPPKPTLHIYKHKFTKDVVTLNSDYKVHSPKSERIKLLLKNRDNILKLIRNGTLIKMNVQATSINTNINHSYQRSPPNPKLESGPGIIVQDFKHTLTGDIITLTPNFRFVGIKSEKIEKLLANQNLKELVHDGILVKHGTRRKIPTHKQPPLKSPLKGHATIERDSTKPIIDL